MYGAAGHQWLIELSDRVKDLAQRWHLTGLYRAENLSYNYVLLGRQKSKRIVLKVGFDHKALEKEAQTLQAFAGKGAVKLLDQAPGALLLQQAWGNSLKKEFPDFKDDEEAIDIACYVIEKLHQATIPQDIQFPQVSDWLAVFDKKIIEIPDDNLIKDIKNYLLETAGPPVLLHGDLHQENILSHRSKWLAIDPKGVIGEQTYEVGAFILNPLTELVSSQNPHQIIKKRILIFADFLNLDAQRILLWCFVQAMLKWAWAIEDNLDQKNFKQLAVIVAEIVTAAYSKKF